MLTVKQKQVLDYIRSQLAEAGVSPSFREIRTALGLSSLSTVTHHVHTLIRKGYLANAGGYHGKRGLQVLPAAREGSLEIPLAGVIAAGRPIEAVAADESVAVPPAFAGPGRYALRVQGDSMVDDGVLDGDVVIVRQADTARNREMVVALINGEATLKRLVRRNRNAELHPANPDYPVITVDPEADFRIQGVAIGIIRRF